METAAHQAHEADNAIEAVSGCPTIALEGAKGMAWDTIQATDDLTVGLWPAGGADNQPHLKIRSKAMESAVAVYLDEVRHLIAALVDAATQLAGAEVSRHD